MFVLEGDFLSIWPGTVRVVSHFSCGLQGFTVSTCLFWAWEGWSGFETADKIVLQGNLILLSFLPLPAHHSMLLLSEEEGGGLRHVRLIRGNMADLGSDPLELQKKTSCYSGREEHRTWDQPPPLQLLSGDNQEALNGCPMGPGHAG